MFFLFGTLGCGKVHNKKNSHISNLRTQTSKLLNRDESLRLSPYEQFRKSPHNLKKNTVFYIFKVEIQPDNVSGWLSLGRLQISLGQNEEALQSVNKALKLEPFNEIGWNIKASVSKFTGNFTSKPNKRS